MKIGKGIDSTDSSFEQPEPAKEVIQKVEAPKALSSYSNKETKAETVKLESKPKVRDGEMEAVKKWQAKRGLVADGIWGKNTQAAYEKEQASKKMKLNKTKPIQESIKSASKPEEQIKSSVETSTKPKKTSFDSPKQIGEGVKGGSKPDTKMVSNSTKKVEIKNAITPEAKTQPKKKMKLTYDSTRGGMPWNHYKTEDEVKEEKKTKKPSEGLSKYLKFNSVPNLDYSKFPKAKKK
jgi:hypothetical protein